MPFCCSIAFSKHVKLCFSPHSGFVIPHVKMLGGGGGGGVYWNHRVLVSVSSCICLPGFVQKIFSEQLNLLYLNLIWWSIVLSRCVVHKNWDAIFKVKVTIRTCIITIWLFQLYQCYIFSTFFSSTELRLLVDHHNPKQTLKMCFCCVKDQGHSNGSKYNLTFVRTVPSEPLKL